MIIKLQFPCEEAAENMGNATLEAFLLQGIPVVVAIHQNTVVIGMEHGYNFRGLKGSTLRPLLIKPSREDRQYVKTMIFARGFLPLPQLQLN